MFCFVQYSAVGNRSALPVEKEAASLRQQKREDDMFEKEGEETLKENGEQQSNGIGADVKSDRSTDRQPDVVDDHPGKSRSTLHTSHPVILCVY